MGQNPHIVEEVTRWVREATDLPIWAKMTPDCTDIVAPSKAAFDGGADGIAAINTLPSIVGVDLENLRPLPTVEGYSTPGGFSYYAVKPLALRKISEIAKALPGKDISGIGGVISSQEAIEFILMGSSTVQVCTGVMLQGYAMIEELNQGLSDFLDKHGFKSLRDAVSAATLPQGKSGNVAFDSAGDRASSSELENLEQFADQLGLVPCRIENGVIAYFN